ncbi:MAG: hypothetical protein AAFQ94_12295 [Bacteroidota bacterium]
MKNEQIFMMVFRFTPDFEKVPTEQEIAEMREQWGAFIGNLAIQEKLVSTYQLGFDSQLISVDGTVSDEIYYSDNRTISGNMIVKANGIDEATEMAKASPILKAGGTVEVRSIIPMDR